MNTQNKLELICKTDIKPAGGGCRPIRVVMRLNAFDSATPYVVHLETDPDQFGSNGYHYGDYCANQLEAFEAYIAKCRHYGLTPLDAMGKAITKTRVE